MAAVPTYPYICARHKLRFVSKIRCDIADQLNAAARNGETNGRMGMPVLWIRCLLVWRASGKGDEFLTHLESRNAPNKNWLENPAHSENNDDDDDFYDEDDDDDDDEADDYRGPL